MAQAEGRFIRIRPEYEEIRMTVKQYAEHKKISEKTVYRRIEKGVLPSEQPAPHYPHEIVLLFRKKNL